jgi:hypothetical protein
MPALRALGALVLSTLALLGFAASAHADLDWVNADGQHARALDAQRRVGQPSFVAAHWRDRPRIAQRLSVRQANECSPHEQLE